MSSTFLRGLLVFLEWPLKGTSMMLEIHYLLKLGKFLRFEGAKVYYSDEYAKNKDFCTKEGC